MGSGTSNGSIATQFQPGHRRSVGNTHGPTKVTSMLKTLIMGAADDLGEDGKGKDGARGWLRKQAREIPADYLKLIGKIFPSYVAFELRAQINNNTIVHSTERDDYKDLEEVRRALEEDGIAVGHFLPDAEKG